MCTQAGIRLAASQPQKDGGLNVALEETVVEARRTCLHACQSCLHTLRGLPHGLSSARLRSPTCIAAAGVSTLDL